MGKLIWSQWARLIALTAGVFETIGGIFGLFYRISTFEPVT
ncbi:20688_t:CDS:2, partial [Dentiscutata erythropus]